MNARGVYLTQLSVKNYLFFNNRATLNLEVDPASGKSLIVIGGENGAGKTTLLNAIKYTITGLNPSDARGMFSEEPIDDVMEFHLAFRWGESHYRLTRQYDRRDDFLRNSTLEFNGDVEREEKRIKESIDTIFPPNLLDLFFFDVEEVKELLTRDTVGEDIKQQIERLLGIELVRQSRDDARQIAGESDTSGEGQLVSAPEIEARIDEVSQHRAEKVAEIQEAEQRVHQLEQKLTQMPSSANAQRVQGQIGMKQAEIAAAGETINGLRDESISYIKGNMAYELLWPLISQFAAEDSTRDESDGPLFDREKVLEAVQQRAAEIESVGLSVEQAEKLIAVLASGREYALPDLVGSSLRVRAQLQAASSVRQTAVALRSALESEVAGRERLRQQYEQMQNELHRQQGDSEEREFTEGYLEDTQEKLERLLKQQEDYDEELQRLRSEKSAAERRTTEYSVKKSREGLAQQYVQVFSQMLEIGRQRLIGRLGEEATRFFHDLDNDPDLYGEIRFDSAYHPHLLRRGERWDPMNLSQGHQTVFAYAVLGALMKLSGSSLPAVIDTPMMKLDSTHKSNVVDSLYPCLSHQVILFSSEEELDAVYFPRLEPHVERTYLIQKRPTTAERGVSKSSFVEEGYFDFGRIADG